MVMKEKKEEGIDALTDTLQPLPAKKEFLTLKHKHL